MYRWIDHTAELELELEAPSAEAVLGEALSAFAELAGPAHGGGAVREVELDAPDLPALLAAWLDELVFLSETDGLVPERADVTLTGAALRATVHGRLGAPRPLVKAVTLHRLELAPADGGWHGRVVLDV